MDHPPTLRRLAHDTLPRQLDSSRILLLDAHWRDLPADVARLSDAERRRAAGIAQPERRAQWIRARGWVRRVVGDLLGCAPVDVPLAVAATGKPSIPDTDLAFSLTYAGPRVALAVGRGMALGLDLVRDDPLLRLPDDLAPALCATEFAALMAADRKDILRHWARREALAKALGTGMIAPVAPDHLAVLLRQLHRCAPDQPRSLHDGWLWDLPQAEGASGALVALVA